MRCLGYSQVSVTLDAYDKSSDAFDAIPQMPSTLHAHGAQVGVRSVVDGIIPEIRDDKARLPGIQTVLASAACSAALPRRASVAPLLMTSLVAPR